MLLQEPRVLILNGICLAELIFTQSYQGMVHILVNLVVVEVFHHSRLVKSCSPKLVFAAGNCDVPFVLTALHVEFHELSIVHDSCCILHYHDVHGVKFIGFEGENAVDSRE